MAQPIIRCCEVSELPPGCGLFLETRQKERVRPGQIYCENVAERRQTGRKFLLWILVYFFFHFVPHWNIAPKFTINSLKAKNAFVANRLTNDDYKRVINNKTQFNLVEHGFDFVQEASAASTFASGLLFFSACFRLFALLAFRWFCFCSCSTRSLTTAVCCSTCWLGVSSGFTRTCAARHVSESGEREQKFNLSN